MSTVWYVGYDGIEYPIETWERDESRPQEDPEPEAINTGDEVWSLILIDGEVKHGRVERIFWRASRLSGPVEMARVKWDDGTRGNYPLYNLERDGTEGREAQEVGEAEFDAYYHWQAQQRAEMPLPESFDNMPW